MSTERLTKKQHNILEHLNFPTEYLVDYLLFEGGTPFDFRSIYNRLDQQDYNYTSTQAVSLRRTLRTMEHKGLLKRGSVTTEIRNGINGQVATWHIPANYDRDCRLQDALPAIYTIKHQKVTEHTPPHLIKSTMLGDYVESEWLGPLLIDWLDGKTECIGLPSWVQVPQLEKAEPERMLVSH